MKVIDLIKISRESMKMLSKADIKMDDYRYVELFSEFEGMLKRGDKTSYAVARLAEVYKISEASVYRVLRRFRKEV